jgi:hypothetical protein
MHKPLMVEIFSDHPLEMHECMNCEIIWSDIEENGHSHQQQSLAHLQGAEALECMRISGWVTNILREYGDQVQVRVIDAVSLEGVVKSAQYGIHACPAVVINHEDVYTAYLLDQASQEVEDLIRHAHQLT